MGIEVHVNGDTNSNVKPKSVRPKIKNNLGKLIKENIAISYSGFARMIRVSPLTVKRWVDGLNFPSERNMTAIIDALDGHSDTSISWRDIYAYDKEIPSKAATNKLIAESKKVCKEVVDLIEFAENNTIQNEDEGELLNAKEAVNEILDETKNSIAIELGVKPEEITIWYSVTLTGQR